MTATVSDGLINLVSGMGTARDKGGQEVWSVAYRSDAEYSAVYKSSPLARRVVDMPAQDAVREWREWSGESADVSAIEAEEKRHGLQGKLLKAQIFARLFGGAALLIGDGARDLTTPIDPARIGRGGLKYVTLLTMRDLTSGPLSTDLTSGRFGMPEHWTLNTATGAGVRLHPSRLAIFHGIEPLGQYDTGGYTGWGESVLLGGMESITRLEAVAKNTNSLVYEAKVDVISIPDFTLNLREGGDKYAAAVLQRVSLVATGKGINGTIIKDALEGYDQKTASFGGLDAIIDRFMQLVSAAHGIPMTLLFGDSASGLNATGAGDARAYYDRVRVQQTMSVEPAMNILDECLIWSALGKRPADVFFNWRPLWQQTAKERAEVGKLLVDALSALDAMDVISSEAISQVAVSALTESGAFSGLEAAVKEFGAPDDLDELAE
jgi:phage-related protein (TIGR01555 family)